MTDTTITAEAVASLAARSVRDRLASLHAHGLPLDALLSGVLGEAIGIFARDQGWDEAALLCDELARQARTLAQPGAAALAVAPVAGQA